MHETCASWLDTRKTTTPATEALTEQVIKVRHTTIKSLSICELHTQIDDSNTCVYSMYRCFGASASASGNTNLFSGLPNLISCCFSLTSTWPLRG